MSFTSHLSAFSSKKKILIAAICAAVLLLAASGFMSARFLSDPYNCRIAENVTIGGLDVGGMTKRQARKTLKATLTETLYAEDLTLELPMQTLSVSPSDTDVEVDVRAAVKDAYKLGRDRLDGTTDIDLRPYLKFNDASLRTELENYARQYDTEFFQSQYALTGSAPDLSTDAFDPNTDPQILTLTLGIPEAHLDIEEALDCVLSAYARSVRDCGTGSYCVSMDVVPQRIPEELDPDKIYEEVCVQPVSDSLDMTAYTFVPGSYGYVFDMAAAKVLLAQAAPGETVSVPMEYVAPEILGDAVYFRDELGHCETKHSNNENRNTNLRLLCEALNGVIVQPGETFSYNEALGERTAEKGYKPAPAYSGNRLKDAIGGGVCQGSSTLYNCALLADLEIVERTCHGAAVAYLPYGLDAAVNWGTTDFKFRNNFHFPVKIQAETTEDYVNMKILGTDEKDYYIEMTSGYDDSSDVAIYAVSYKNKYSKQTGELISKEREANSTYYRNIG